MELLEELEVTFGHGLVSGMILAALVIFAGWRLALWIGKILSERPKD